jgi:hypothetical protein
MIASSTVSLEAVTMNAHAPTYPALQRRLISTRRSRALFLPHTTQHMRSHSVLAELARAAVAVLALATWCVSLLLIAG